MFDGCCWIPPHEIRSRCSLPRSCVGLSEWWITSEGLETVVEGWEMQAFCAPRLFSVVATGIEVGHGDTGRKAYSCRRLVPLRALRCRSRDDSSSEAKLSKVPKIVTEKTRVQKENASSVHHQGNNRQKTVSDYLDEVCTYPNIQSAIMGH